MDIIKIAVLGIVGALLGIMLKGQKKEYELFMTLGVSLCIFYFIMSKLKRGRLKCLGSFQYWQSACRSS